MPGEHNLESIRKQERELLRLLCNLPDAPPGRARSHALCSLSAHDWKDGDHRVVFNALRRSPGWAPALLREQLPAEATRLGFPEVDWSVFFDDLMPPNPAKIESLAIQLLRICGEEPQRP